MDDQSNTPLDSEPTGSTDLLADGEMAIQGRMPWSSNATFLVTLTLADESTQAIYKPHRGERPLWDFPSGLFKREAAAYELCALLGWSVIPRTIVRDGEFGVGSVQQFIDARFEEHYFTMLENMPDTHEQLRVLAALDLIANNADRKGGHVLLDKDGRIWGIDNGLSFHEEQKLRTVMWDFAGEKIPKTLLDDIKRVAELPIPDFGPLTELLTEDELVVLQKRAQRVVKKPVFPPPTSDYAYPWPMV